MAMQGRPDRSFSVQPAPAATLDLHGKHVAVVGGTDGLGRAIARLAASRGASVVVVGRTFRDEGAANLSFVKADLSSMREAARVGRELPAERLDAVIFTTGIMAAKTREATAEGLERDMAISYLSRLAVLRELAPRLGSGRAAGSPAPRVFVMGFPGTGGLGEVDDLNAERSYDAMKVHLTTVAGNEALVLDGKRRYPNIRFFGLNPGLVKTKIRANYLGEGSVMHRIAEALIGLLSKSPETYAARVLPLLVAPELEGRSGAMFDARARPILASEGMTEAHVAKFIAGSEALVRGALER